MPDKPTEESDLTSSSADAQRDGAEADLSAGASPNDARSTLGDAASPAPDTDDISSDDLEALLAAAETEIAGSAEPLDDATLSSTDPNDERGEPSEDTARAEPAALDDEGQAAPGVGASFDAAPFQAVDLPVVPSGSIDPKKVSMLSDVKLRVRIQLGRTRMLVEDVLKLTEGSVVELDKLAGDPVDVLVNDRLIARGEVLVLDDEFCVRISEVLSHDPHRITT